MGLPAFESFSFAHSSPWIERQACMKVIGELKVKCQNAVHATSSEGISSHCCAVWQKVKYRTILIYSLYISKSYSNYAATSVHKQNSKRYRMLRLRDFKQKCQRSNCSAKCRDEMLADHQHIPTTTWCSISTATQPIRKVKNGMYKTSCRFCINSALLHTISSSVVQFYFAEVPK